MNIRNAPAANFSSELIPVEFLVLHYTAVTLEETLQIFSSPERRVCAHFVIDLDGTIYDLGGFWDGPIYRGAHAGESRFDLQGKKWENFNHFSIGIEIVNPNGNLCFYPDAQYDSLARLTQHLMTRFPALKDPCRIVGHEQIAGFRGKADPGCRFDWKRFFSDSYKTGNFPERKSVLDAAGVASFEAAHGKIEIEKLRPEEWQSLSAKLETYIAGLQAKKNS